MEKNVEKSCFNAIRKFEFLNDAEQILFSAFLQYQIDMIDINTQCDYDAKIAEYVNKQFTCWKSFYRPNHMLLLDRTVEKIEADRKAKTFSNQKAKQEESLVNNETRVKVDECFANDYHDCEMHCYTDHGGFVIMKMLEKVTGKLESELKSRYIKSEHVVIINHDEFNVYSLRNDINASSDGYGYVTLDVLKTNMK